MRITIHVSAVCLWSLFAMYINAAEIRISPRNLNGTPIAGLAGANFVVTISGGGQRLVATYQNGSVQPTGSPNIALAFNDTDVNNPFFAITLNDGLFPTEVNGRESNLALVANFRLAVGGQRRLSPADVQDVLPRGEQTFILAFPKEGETGTATCNCCATRRRFRHR